MIPKLSGLKQQACVISHNCVGQLVVHLVGPAQFISAVSWHLS